MEPKLSEEELLEQKVRQRKVLWISIAAAVGTMLVAGLIWYAIFSSQFGTFSENRYYIKIKYPKTWEVARGYQGTVVTFVSPKEDGLDTTQENLNIAVTDLSQHPQSLDEYTKIAINQMNVVFKKTITVTESKLIWFAGRQAYRFSIHSPEPDDLVLTFIWFINGTDAYTITYISQKLQIEKYQAKFDEMLRSFSIPTL